MPPSPTEGPTLEQAEQLATFAAGLAAVLAFFLAALRWPLRAAGRATHRFFGELAFAEELKRGADTAATVARMSPIVEKTALDVEEIKQDVRRIYDHMLAGHHAPARAPDSALPPFPRHEAPAPK